MESSGKPLVLYGLALSLLADPMKSIAQRSAELRAEPLPPPFAQLVPLAQPKHPPHPGDWLAVHPKNLVCRENGTRRRGSPALARHQSAHE